MKGDGGGEIVGPDADGRIDIGDGVKINCKRVVVDEGARVEGAARAVLRPPINLLGSGNEIPTAATTTTTTTTCGSPEPQRALVDRYCVLRIVAIVHAEEVVVPPILDVHVE